MKKWKDAGEVLKMVHELPVKLRESDKLMREKPGFRKGDEFVGKRKNKRICKNFEKEKRFCKNYQGKGGESCKENCVKNLKKKK